MLLLGTLAIGVYLLGPSQTARAQSPKDVAQAKVLFRAGARAYKAGQFDAAARAFEQAYELAKRPSLRFSAAQALRRQYAVSQEPEQLHRALAYYQQYLTTVKQGGRRFDTIKAIGEIRVLLAQHPTSSEQGAGGGAETPSKPAAIEAATTLVIDSPVEGATVSLDGKAASKVPLIVDVSPGAHRIVVTAPGHVSVERQAHAVKGRLTPVDVPLKEQPASLEITADNGAEVLVDGRPSGRAPLPGPISLPSGEHRVVVGDTGYGVFVEDLTLARGQDKRVNVDLKMTPQRWSAWFLLGSAVVTSGVGVGLAVAAAGRQRDAKDIIDASTVAKQALSVEQAEEYNSHISTRDNLRRISGITIGVGVLGGALGLLLYSLDAPKLYAAAAKDSDNKKDKAEPKQKGPADNQPVPPHDSDPLELTAILAPLPGGGFFGATVRF